MASACTVPIGVNAVTVELGRNAISVPLTLNTVTVPIGFECIEGPSVVDALPDPSCECLCVYRTFSYAHPTPIALFEQNTDEIIVDATIGIDTAWDGGATLALGTLATPGLIFDTTELKLSTAGVQFQCAEKQIATVTRTIQLTITPAAATQGVGWVLLLIKRI